VDVSCVGIVAGESSRKVKKWSVDSTEYKCSQWSERNIFERGSAAAAGRPGVTSKYIV
jgi:hypothetical protein